MHFQTLVKDDVRQIQFKIHLPPIPHPPSQMYISRIRDRTISLEISYSHPHSSATMSL